MKKKICMVLACALSLMMLASCSSYGQKAIDGGPSATDAVVNNGEFMVQKGDYYFYINGKATSSDANVFGSVVKGSIVRSPIDDLTNQTVIVPKLVVNGYANGINMLGEYIYYCSPNDEKNKDGIVESSYLDFMRTKIDGSGTEKLFTVSDNTSKFSVYQRSDVSYIAYTGVNDDSRSVVFEYNTSTKELKTAVEFMSGTPLFLDDCILYTGSVYIDSITREENEELNAGSDEDALEGYEVATYNKLMKYSFSDAKETRLSSTTSSSVTVSSENQGYVYFDIAAVEDGKPKNTATYRLKSSDLDYSKLELVSLAQTGLTSFIAMENGFIKQDGDYIKWYALDSSSVMQIKIIAKDTLSTFLKVDGDTLYALDSLGLLVSITLPNISWIEGGDTESFLGSDKVEYFGEESLDAIDSTWLPPVEYDGVWYFFNSSADAFNKTADDNDDVSMYKRSGYVFSIDTATNTIERVSKLSGADVTAENDAITAENEIRAERRENA